MDSPFRLRFEFRTVKPLHNTLLREVCNIAPHSEKPVSVTLKEIWSAGLTIRRPLALPAFAFHVYECQNDEV